MQLKFGKNIPDVQKYEPEASALWRRRMARRLIKKNKK